MWQRHGFEMLVNRRNESPLDLFGQYAERDQETRWENALHLKEFNHAKKTDSRVGPRPAAWRHAFARGLQHDLRRWS
jgi:hypothetical protein